jgi:hypothetical protein
VALAQLMSLHSSFFFSSHSLILSCWASHAEARIVIIRLTAQFHSVKLKMAIFQDFFTLTACAP